MKGRMRAMRHSTRKLDLTGQRFGKLSVLGPAENIGVQTAWRCRCDCGRETVVTTKRLRAGRTVSCGCVYGKSIGKRLTYVDGTCVEMLRAKTVRRNNTSGVPGVGWTPSKGLWRATICFKGKRYYLGGYKSFEDAVQARKRAEEELHDGFVRQFSGLPEAQKQTPVVPDEKGGSPMEEAIPPWNGPTVTCADGGGSRG